MNPIALIRNLRGRYLARQQPFRVCLWHIGRCGSSVVADLVQQDGRFDWGGETLEPYSKEDGSTWSGARKLLRRRMWQAAERPFGFEMKYWHHIRLGRTAEQVSAMLTDLGFTHNVVLERRNRLRQHVSGQVARKTGQFHVRSGDAPARATLHVDLDEIISWFEECDRYHGLLRSMLPGHLYLTYEDDVLHDPTVAYEKLSRHVGLEPREVSTTLRRTNPRPLKAIIENWEDIVSGLSGTEHEWMLSG